jgi:hypothetical protein
LRSDVDLDESRTNGGWDGWHQSYGLSCLPRGHSEGECFPSVVREISADTFPVPKDRRIYGSVIISQFSEDPSDPWFTGSCSRVEEAYLTNLGHHETLAPSFSRDFSTMLTQIFSVFETSCKWYLSGVSIVSPSILCCIYRDARTNVLGLVHSHGVYGWSTFLLFPFSPIVRYSGDSRPL